MILPALVPLAPEAQKPVILGVVGARTVALDCSNA